MNEYFTFWCNPDFKTSFLCGNISNNGGLCRGSFDKT